MPDWMIYLAIAVLALTALMALKPGLVTIHDHETGLLYSRGKLGRMLGAGWYLALGAFRSILVVDVRSRVLSIPGQEILSADNVSVKVSVGLRLRVSEPVKSVQGSQSFEEALYLEAQLILRDLVSALPIEELLAKRGALVTLKTLQAAGDGKHTLVLGLPQHSFIPLKESEPAERPPNPPPRESPEEGG